jgi:hypothetical protein
MAGGHVLEPVLDPDQLLRIEATHRGFGYQHLYGVACLLSLGSTATDVVIIEHDEDIELVRAGTHIYVQVKTRNRLLRPSDVDTALRRFDALRGEHNHGRRSGTARFVLISNVEPGPELRARLARTEWPGDVVLLWPGCPNPDVDLQVPAAWPDFAVGLQACVAQAALIPFGSLRPPVVAEGHVR